jgi:hypothetical protein
MFNYQTLISDNAITSIDELNKLFWDEIAYDWIGAYKRDSPSNGEITIQNFGGYCFIIDDGNQLRNEKSQDKEILESRVVGAFGISNMNVNPRNRSTMRRWIGKTTEIFSPYGNNYDKGHFIAHASGGPIDVNLFPQRRDINRGIGEPGKRYRDMEKYIVANPGTFVFSRPIYNDLSFCPNQIEFGFCDNNLIFTHYCFPNR